MTLYCFTSKYLCFISFHFYSCFILFNLGLQLVQDSVCLNTLKEWIYYTLIAFLSNWGFEVQGLMAQVSYSFSSCSIFVVLLITSTTHCHFLFPLSQKSKYSFSKVYKFKISFKQFNSFTTVSRSF